MLTPAITASSTSLPCAIIDHAFSTAVMSPPFLKRLPFEEETTTGFAGLRRITVGADCGRAVAAIAAAPLATNVRRVTGFFTRESYSIFSDGGSGSSTAAFSSVGEVTTTSGETTFA